MAKEPETYRLNLESVINAFPDKAMLTVTDVVSHTGIGRAMFLADDKFTKLCLKSGRNRYISRESLAYYLSGQVQ